MPITLKVIVFLGDFNRMAMRVYGDTNLLEMMTELLSRSQVLEETYN